MIVLREKKNNTSQNIDGKFEKGVVNFNRVAREGF